jgi:hypothetical protein
VLGVKEKYLHNSALFTCQDLFDVSRELVQQPQLRLEAWPGNLPTNSRPDIL